MAKKRVSSERAMEKRDSGMIGNDASKPANLPHEVKWTTWPSSGESMNYSYNDDISGINDQMGSDVRGAKRQKGGSKY